MHLIQSFWLLNVRFQSASSYHSNYWILDSYPPNLIIPTIKYWIPIHLIWPLQLLNIGFQSTRSNHSNYIILHSNLSHPIIPTTEYYILISLSNKLVVPILSMKWDHLIIMTIQYCILICLIWLFWQLNIGSHPASPITMVVSILDRNIQGKGIDSIQCVIHY